MNPPGDHAGGGLRYHVPKHSPKPGLADRAAPEFSEPLSLACLDRGQQLGRPLYRFGEEVGAERDRQKRRRAQAEEPFRPAPPEVEEPVSANEVEPPPS